MKIVLLIVVCLVISAGANAVDVYGLHSREAEKIIKRYGKKINNIERVVKAQQGRHVSDLELKKAMDIARMKRTNLLKEMTKRYGYLFVDFQTIYYPVDDKYYTTIEVVDKEHPERMRFVSAVPLVKQEKNITQPLDLIDEMLAYNDSSLQLLMKHEVEAGSASCPVYHCVVGFEHPQLKPYLARFNQGAVQQKSLIINTLNDDKNPDRRAAAAYLVGHFHDPHEIITVLSLHVLDKDVGVRNNVMRVLGSTLEKAKISDLDVTPFIDALDSPYTTDRNKALYILLVTVKSKVSRDLVIQKGGNRLIALMHLEQPNNHDMAYLVLKQLSGKDFGDKNVLAWRQWVSTAQQFVLS